MAEQDNLRIDRQLRELCAFLPTLFQRPEVQRPRLIYERGARQMLDSDNRNASLTRRRSTFERSANSHVW